MTDDPRSQLPERELIGRACELYEQGGCDEAVDLLLALVKKSPGARPPAVALARLLLDSARFADALSVLEGLAAAGDDPELALLRGRCAAGMGDWDKAAEAAYAVLAIDPQNAAALCLKAEALLGRGETQAAEALLGRALQLAPELSEVYTHLAALAGARGESDAVWEMRRAAFQREPQGRRTALDYHGEAVAQGRLAAAVEDFAHAVSRRPQNQRLRCLHLDLLLRQHRDTEALVAAQDCLALFGPGQGLLEAALAVRRRLPARVSEPPAAEGGRISLCMITRNEERDLARCLASVRSLVHEIVVVDTGSADRTVEVAQLFGARVEIMEWGRDFAAARNHGLALATGDWILVLDADEVVAEADIETLAGLTTGAPAAYSMVTRNYTRQANLVGWMPNDGRCPRQEAGNGWYPSRKVRLFPNDARVRFRYPVHELVEPSLEAAGIEIRPCPVPVHHYGKLDERRSQAKALAYYEIGRRKLAALGDNLPALREMAIQAAGLGRHAEAAELWRRVLRLAPESAEAYVNLGSACWNLGDYRQAAECAEQAVRLSPELKEARFNRALARLYLGDAAAAAVELERLLQRHPRYLAAGFMLGCALACAGRERRAQAAFRAVGHQLRPPELAAAAGEVCRRMAQAGRANWAADIERCLADCKVEDGRTPHGRRSLQPAGG